MRVLANIKTMEQTKQKRILTGDNPTGKLHLGHYVGSLQNRVKLQSQYDTFIIIADMHTLAYPKYTFNTKLVSDSVFDVLVDNLAVGLDPKKVKFFTESSIPEIYQIASILSMLVTHARALRNPTLKEEIQVKSLGDNYSLGFINFPIYQAADILCVNADLVPVGEDQVPHIELTREVARKFNSSYGEVFVEPKPLVGDVKRLVGLDGDAKMTKSLDNAVYLSDSSAVLKKKIMSMFTDPNRIHPTDPGNVAGNPVFDYHDAFNPDTAEVADLKERYKLGKVGDVEVKEKLFKVLDTLLEPIRERRAHYEKIPAEVYDILHHGTKITREESLATLNKMREAMSFIY
jgi:tryptophanyl-tRNA synthetase